MAAMVPLTVIVLNYRNAQATCRCLDSLASSVRFIDTLVVVDNSAEPRQAAALEDYLGRSNDLGAKAQLLVFPENYGFAGGVNRALAHPAVDRSGWCLLLNNDVVVNEAVFRRFNESCRDQDRFVSPMIRTDGHAYGYQWYGRYTGTITRRRTPIAIRYVPAACLFVNLFGLTPPLLDESFFLYGEDVMMFHQFDPEGSVTHLLSDVSVIHEGSLSSRPGSLFYEYHLNRAHRLLTRKLSRNRADRLVAAVVKEAALVARGMLRAARFASSKPLAGYLLSYTDRRIRPEQ